MQPAPAAQWWHHLEVEAAAEQGLEGAQGWQCWLVCARPKHLSALSAMCHATIAVLAAAQYMLLCEMLLSLLGCWQIV